MSSVLHRTKAAWCVRGWHAGVDGEMKLTVTACWVDDNDEFLDEHSHIEIECGYYTQLGVFIEDHFDRKAPSKYNKKCFPVIDIRKAQTWPHA